MSVSNKHLQGSNDLSLTSRLGKGVGSLGSGIWGGLTGKGGKTEEEE